jgi:hypothetical protein
VQYLAPFLPYLLKGVKLAGQEAAKKLGEKAGEQGFDHAKALLRQNKALPEARALTRRAVKIFTRLRSPDLQEAQETLEEMESANH